MTVSLTVCLVRKQHVRNIQYTFELPHNESLYLHVLALLLVTVSPVKTHFENGNWCRKTNISENVSKKLEKYSFSSFFNCVNILNSKIYTSFNMFANVLVGWQHLHIMTYVPILAFVSKAHINFIGLAPLQWLWLFSKCQIRWLVLRDYKNIKFKCHWRKWFQNRNNLVVVVMHD